MCYMPAYVAFVSLTSVGHNCQVTAGLLRSASRYNLCKMGKYEISPFLGHLCVTQFFLILKRSYLKSYRTFGAVNFQFCSIFETVSNAALTASLLIATTFIWPL